MMTKRKTTDDEGGEESEAALERKERRAPNRKAVAVDGVGAAYTSVTWNFPKVNLTLASNQVDQALELPSFGSHLHRDKIYSCRNGVLQTFFSERDVR